MASDEDRIPKFVNIDEQYGSNRADSILFGFEQELKSVTVREGDSARLEAKIRLLSTSSNIQIDRSLLHVEWRLNDTHITSDHNPRYRFNSISEENLYWMDIRLCEQQDEGVYTIYISYDHDRFHDESSAYLFVDSFTNEKEEQPDQISQQGLSAGDSWSSATSLDRFIPPTITQSLLSTYRYRSGNRVQLQVEYFSPSVQCHCTWQVQHINDSVPQPVQYGSIVNTNYSSTLTIDSITPELQGLYIFHVENVYGHARTQTDIIVNKDDTDDEQQDYLEYQEALEEPPIKKKHTDDESHLHLQGPYHKRISMMHHMPLEETINYEDFKVHIPGGAKEEILIHTEFVPPTPRLSIVGENLKLLPTDTNVDQQQWQPNKEFVDRMQFEELSPSSLIDTVQKYIHENIPQSTALTVQQQEQQLPLLDNIITVEESQNISSAPIVYDEGLSNVDQWSDFVPDSNTDVPSPLRRASKISRLMMSANEFDEGQHIAHLIDQRIAVGSVRTSDKTNIIQQPESRPDFSILDKGAIARSQSEIPQSYEYKAPADLKQESTATLRTDTLALSGHDIESQETPINVDHQRRQESGGIEQIAKLVSQPSVTIDFPILDESSVYLDQLQRPELPQSVTYKAPADIQSTAGSLFTSASAFSQDEPAHDTPININQFIQHTAQDKPVSDTTEQQTTTIIQSSAITDSPILQEVLAHLDQVHLLDAAQSVQYEAPTDIQLVTGSRSAVPSARITEESAQETPVNINQLRQSMAKGFSAADGIQQQVSSVMRLSTATDLPILDETSIHLDQIHRPDIPQTVQYKAPVDIEPSAGSIRTTTSALSIEEPARDVSCNVTQLHQATARDLSDTGRQRASVISILSQAVGLPVLDEAPFNINQIQRTEAPQSFEYKAPADIKQVSATLYSTPSVLASDIEHDQTMLSSAEGYQQQQGYKKYRPSVVSDLSYASAEDEFSELPHEVQVQQQRLLKMPRKLLEQPKIIQNRSSIVENDDQAQSTSLSHRRQMVAALKKLEDKEIEEKEKEKEKEKEEETDSTISPEISMNVDEIIETIHVEDELLEPKKPFVTDIYVPTDEDMSLLTSTFVDVLPSIAETSLPVNQLETIASDQTAKEETQSLINQIDQVSSSQIGSLDLPTMEDISSYVSIEQEQPTLMTQSTEEPFELSFEKIVDYIEIPHSKSDSDENKPEAIIIIDEIKPMKPISTFEDTTGYVVLSENVPILNLKSENIQQINGDTTTEHISHTSLIDRSGRLHDESVESLSVPVQPNLLPLATMPDVAIHADKRHTPERSIQDVLASISKDHDEFFDTESEGASGTTKNEAIRIAPFHEPPITLAIVEKLQHDAAIDLKMDEFHEPQPIVTSMEAPDIKESQPIETKDVEQEIPLQTIVQEEDERILLAQQEPILEKQTTELLLSSEQQPISIQIVESNQEIPPIKNEEQSKISQNEQEPTVYEIIQTSAATEIQSLMQVPSTIQKIDINQNVIEIPSEQVLSSDKIITQEATTQLQTLPTVEKQETTEKIESSTLETDQLSQTLRFEPAIEQALNVDTLKTDDIIVITTPQMTTTTETSSIPMEHIAHETIPITQQYVSQQSSEFKEKHSTKEGKSTVETTGTGTTISVEQQDLFTPLDEQKSKLAELQQPITLQVEEHEKISAEKQELPQLKEMEQTVLPEEKLKLVFDQTQQLSEANEEQKAIKFEMSEEQPTVTYQIQPAQFDQQLEKSAGEQTFISMEESEPLLFRAQELQQKTIEALQQTQPQLISKDKVEHIEGQKVEIFEKERPQSVVEEKIETEEQIQQRLIQELQSIREDKDSVVEVAQIEKAQPETKQKTIPTETSQGPSHKQLDMQLDTITKPQQVTKIQEEKSQPVDEAQLPKTTNITEEVPHSVQIQPTEHAQLLPTIPVMPVEQKQPSQSTQVSEEKSQPVEVQQVEELQISQPVEVVQNEEPKPIQTSTEKLESVEVKLTQETIPTQVLEEAAKPIEVKSIAEVEQPKPKNVLGEKSETVDVKKIEVAQPSHAPDGKSQPVEGTQIEETQAKPTEVYQETTQLIEAIQVEENQQIKPTQLSQAKPQSVEVTQIEEAQPTQTSTDKPYPVEVKSIEETKQQTPRDVPDKKPETVEVNSIEELEQPKPIDVAQEKLQYVEVKKTEDAQSSHVPDEEPQQVEVKSIEDAITTHIHEDKLQPVGIKLIEEVQVPKQIQLLEENPQPAEVKQVEEAESSQPKEIPIEKPQPIEITENLKQTNVLQETPEAVKVKSIEETEQPKLTNVSEEKVHPVEIKEIGEVQPSYVSDENSQPVAVKPVDETIPMQSTRIPDEKPQSVDVKHVEEVQQSQSTEVLQQKTQSIEIRQEDEVQLSQPLPVTPVEMIKAPQSTEVPEKELQTLEVKQIVETQHSEQPQISEEKPKPVEFNRDEQTQLSQPVLVKSIDDNKQSESTHAPEGEQKPSEKIQSKPTVENKPKIVEENRAEKIQDQKQSAAAHQKPQPVEEEKLEKVDESHTQTLITETLKQVEEPLATNTDEFKLKTIAEEDKKKRADTQQQIEPEESKSETAPQDKSKITEEEKTKLIEPTPSKQVEESKIAIPTEEKTTQEDTTKVKKAEKPGNEASAEDKGKSVEETKLKTATEGKTTTLDTKKHKQAEQSKSIEVEKPNKVDEKTILPEEAALKTINETKPTDATEGKTESPDGAKQKKVGKRKSTTAEEEKPTQLEEGNIKALHEKTNQVKESQSKATLEETTKSHDVHIQNQPEEKANLVGQPKTETPAEDNTKLNETVTFKHFQELEPEVTVDGKAQLYEAKKEKKPEDVHFKQVQQQKPEAIQQTKETAVDEAISRTAEPHTILHSEEYKSNITQDEQTADERQRKPAREDNIPGTEHVHLTDIEQQKKQLSEEETIQSPEKSSPKEAEDETRKLQSAQTTKPSDVQKQTSQAEKQEKTKTINDNLIQLQHAPFPMDEGSEKPAEQTTEAKSHETETKPTKDKTEQWGEQDTTQSQTRADETHKQQDQTPQAPENRTKIIEQPASQQATEDTPETTEEANLTNLPEKTPEESEDTAISNAEHKVEHGQETPPKTSSEDKQIHKSTLTKVIAETTDSEKLPQLGVNAVQVPEATKILDAVKSNKTDDDKAETAKDAQHEATATQKDHPQKAAEVTPKDEKEVKAKAEAKEAKANEAARDQPEVHKEAEEKAQAIEEAKAKKSADEKLKADKEAEENDKAIEEAKATRAAGDKAKAEKEAEEKTKAIEEAKAKKAAESKAIEEANAKKAADEKAKADRDAEEKAKAIEQGKAKKAADEKLKAEKKAEEKAKAIEEAKAKK
ncbi:unnamed protein product, partial [Rotaria magnacalcarata]